MNEIRPSTRLTTRALTYGSLSAATLLAFGLVLGFAGAVDAGSLGGNVGVVVLLITPVVGLIATWSEVRIARPAHGWLAVAVLLVLFLATLIALATRA
jgi:hypothetical protein